MKRWQLLWVVAVLSCIPIILSRSSAQNLLADSDTAYLLKILRQSTNPLQWFTQDWPLGNHFYRPISTLPFQFDNAVYGNQAWGYGLTNAILCCLCVLSLAWLMREITDSIPLSIGATVIFGLWHWHGELWLLYLVLPFSVLLAFAGLFRHGFKIQYWLPALAAITYLGNELAGISALHFRMIAWVPGRTASTMTIFCLLAMAAYARYERTSAERDAAQPTSMDEPAGTRSSVTTEEKQSAAWPYLLISFLATALSLGSYEQAVMLPAALLGVAVSLRLQRYRVQWSWQIVFWGLLVAYIVLRRAVLPDGASDYQQQQLRDGPGVALSLTSYFLPCLASIYMQIQILDLGAVVLLTGQLYNTVWATIANVAGYFAAFRHWRLALTGFLLSGLAYLPMAWLNQFEHYHYWPMALRSLFVAVLAWGVWELCVIAVSPPAQQAPRRPTPAPGSLPRP